MADMTCLRCGEVYTEQERHELHEMREEFYQDNDVFICPGCWDNFRRMDPEEQVKLLILGREGRKMTDREKVIKGLECCRANLLPRCEECPYANIDEGTCFTMDRLHADALALLKAQEPRVMTEQEMRDAEPGAVIYCEQRDGVRTYLTPLIKYDDGVFENRFLGAEPEATQLPNVRFWTSRPTDEQRKAVKWDD